jgi:hypothetical protein
MKANDYCLVIKDIIMIETSKNKEGMFRKVIQTQNFIFIQKLQ